MKKTPLIVGNWKLNPNNLKSALTLAAEIHKLCRKLEVNIALAPTFIHLSEVQKKINSGPIALAAQDVSSQPLGAFTGEVSAMQLKDLGVEYVIIGHSERRAAGETDEIVLQKVRQVLKNKMTPIVCIGEQDRDATGAFFNFIENQINHLTDSLSRSEMKKVVLAYEPIWAIGSGDTATPENVKEMQLFIYSTLVRIYDKTTANAVCLLYGGSVKENNAALLHQEGGMDGFLVGGASLKPAEFAGIIKNIS